MVHSETLSNMASVEFIQQNAVPITISAITLVLSILLYFRLLQSNHDSVTNKTRLDSKTKTNNIPSYSNLPPSNNDVWAERRQRGIANASTSKKENASQEKPFGSSYYYAHNSTNAKGGYTDGLRMEDYTMNGPRLLSKNGVPAVVEEVKVVVSDVVEPQEKSHDVIGKEAPKQSTPPRNILPITKYLWDDPGDASGIATLRIETLPSPNNKNTMVDWKDANIQTVSAKLEGDGLLVVATDSNDNEYRLHIKKLYDRATDVRAVVKPKRLLVKIHKKRNGINILGKSNMEPWPQPQKPSF